MKDYNYIDLFHGIGGFALGAFWSGMRFKNHFCSDIEPYTQELYKLRFPDSIQLGDITKIDTKELLQYGDKWIITGGFPCQDISIAGKGAGITGVRSGLWFEYWRLIRDLRPRYAIMENVSAITFRGLDAVLGSLAEIGYNAEWQNIRASDVGAPHRRERIWIVAYAEQYGERRETDTGDPTVINKSGTWMEKKRREVAYSNDIGRIHGQDEIITAERGKYAQRNVISKGKDVADTGRELRKQGNATGMETDTGQRTYSELYDKSGGERHRGNYWFTEPAVGRLANGVPRRVDRLKGLGNAIVPQIAEILFNQIKNRDNIF